MSVAGAAGARGALRDGHLRAGAGRVRARRGRAAVGLRGAASTSTSSPGSRSTTPATAIRGSSPRSREQAARFAGSSNLYYSEPAMRLCERLAELEPRRARLPLQLGRRGERVRDQAGPQARPRSRDRPARDRHPRRRLPRPHPGGPRGDAEARPRRPLRAAAARASSPCPRDDPDALRAAVGERTAAVMIEPIQGEAGIFPIADEVLVAAREACDEAGAALVFDEVQCGMGRTGTLWAYEQLPVRPDVLTAAKALGGGLPGGRRASRRPELAEVLARGDHGSTFAGAPITAAAALAALEVIDDPELLGRVTALGERLRAGLAALDGGRRGARPRPDGRRHASPRASTPRRSPPAPSTRGLVLNVPGRADAAVPAAAGDRRGGRRPGARDRRRGARGAGAVVSAARDAPSEAL